MNFPGYTPSNAPPYYQNAMGQQQYNMGMGMGVGGMLGSSLYNMFGGYQNPSNAASPYLNNMQGQISPYYQPYINSGQNAMNTLNGQYQQQISNPGGMVNQIGSQYQQSPGYQFNYNQGMDAANSAAASGGMLGTPQHQQQASTMASGLANQDYNQYLGNALGMYGQGIQGLQGMNQMGYNASNEMGNNIGNIMMSQANNAYAGANNQNQSQGGMWGSSGSLVGGLIGWL